MLLQLDLSRGVDPSAMDNEALGNASSRGHVDIVRILLNLDPSRGVRLTRAVVERVYHYNLLSSISEEIFNMYDWSINLTEEHVHELLKHRFNSFERWCREGNFHRLSHNVKSIVREYAFTRTRLNRKRKLPPGFNVYV
jgi:hypothetical protein